MVDEKNIARNPAHKLSFLKKEERRDFLDAMDSEQTTPHYRESNEYVFCPEHQGCAIRECYQSQHDRETADE